MSTVAITQQVADAFLEWTPTHFDTWLSMKAARYPDSDWSLLRTGQLAGTLDEAWARDHASPEILGNW